MLVKKNSDCYLSFARRINFISKFWRFLFYMSKNIIYYTNKILCFIAYKNYKTSEKKTLKSMNTVY